MEYTLFKLWQLISDDKKICAVCGVVLTPEITDIHHIDGKRHNKNPENLQLVCQKCHRGYKSPKRRPTSILITMRFTQEQVTKINQDAEQNDSNFSKIVRKIVNNHYNLTENI